MLPAGFGTKEQTCTKLKQFAVDWGMYKAGRPWTVCPEWLAGDKPLATAGTPTQLALSPRDTPCSRTPLGTRARCKRTHAKFNLQAVRRRRLGDCDGRLAPHMPTTSAGSYARQGVCRCHPNGFARGQLNVMNRIALCEMYAHAATTSKHAPVNHFSNTRPMTFRARAPDLCIGRLKHELDRMTEEPYAVWKTFFVSTPVLSLRRGCLAALPT